MGLSMIDRKPSWIRFPDFLNLVDGTDSTKVYTCSSDSACSDSVTTPMTWHEEEFFGTVSPVKLYQPYATHVGEVLLCRKDIQAWHCADPVSSSDWKLRSS